MIERMKGWFVDDGSASGLRFSAESEYKNASGEAFMKVSFGVSLR
jgi:hypothetical protein